MRGQLGRQVKRFLLNVIYQDRFPCSSHIRNNAPGSIQIVGKRIHAQMAGPLPASGLIDHFAATGVNGKDMHKGVVKAVVDEGHHLFK
ncbi:hypothetical protein SDC9_125499 [bioreactor metagenome]|uniref:Uncharacterized protein n=1 Tax=bioreactor metagenome TaxID=1076179 RepID=A0A645CNK2_9ZZZZ